MSTSLTNARETAHFWRAMIADKGLEPLEQQQLDEWLGQDPQHRIEFELAESLWQALGDIEYPPELKGLPPTENSQSNAGFSLRGLIQQWRPPFNARIAYAACTVFVAGLVFALLPFENTPLETAQRQVYRTDSGEIQALSLSDGSRVTLGAKSLLEIVISSSTRKARLLSGTAFFNVTKDPLRDFTVTANGIKIRVIGTAFDVQTRANKTYIAVQEGTVHVASSDFTTSSIYGPEVRPDSSESHISLNAGQAVSATTQLGLGSITDINTDSVASWRDGQLVYIRATLAEVIADANRYSSTPIQVGPQAKSLKISGTFNSEDMDGMLQNLISALNLKEQERHGIRTLSVELDQPKTHGQ